MTREVIDIEASNLLTHETIDYTASPYKLKPNFKIWCLVQRNVDDPSIVKKYVGLDEIKAWAMWELPKITEFIGHNILDFDLLALKLLGLLKYEISNEFGKPSTINGKPVKITDTLVLSKCLNPDRYGGHSLDEWGKRVGSHKVDWRAQAIELGLITHSAPKGAEFQQWHPKMGDYCEQDTLTNVHALNKLIAEMGDWDWAFPLWLEHIVRDIVTRQSHRGFWFDKELADSNIRDLDRKMAEIKAVVEPLLPPKPLGKTALKEFYPPKIQFKKDGTVSAVMQKWVAKHGGTIKPNSLYEDGPPFVEVYGREWVLPLDTSVPVKTHGPAEITDTTFIKGWLVELGWKPTQYKERDLTCDSKKNKLSDEKFKEAVERYVEQTLASPFCKDRCNELDTTPGRLREYLLKRGNKRPMKVYTNPTITVGMEKEIDPALLDLADKFPHAKLVSEYLTYAHRRNSILGGGVDPDDVDDDDEFAGKGFIAAERIAEDGRIPTPADSCGAGTSRFKHRLVANIPRVTSLYGDKMRAMFGVDVADGFIQLGYDFDSLEAKIEAHYVYKYPGGPEYGVSLTAEKPNDCHTVLATKISKLIGRAFPRRTAKNVKYGCSYNAQPPRIAKTVGCDLETAQVIFNAFWEQAAPLHALKEKMQHYWETIGEKKFLLGADGRKLPIRSKGNVINTAFQSAGVICAKLAMVLHERYLKQEGMWVDFFSDDWRNKDFCQQLIAYHDEAQLEVRRSMVTWKTVKINGPWEVEVTDKDGKVKMEDSPEVKEAKKLLKAFREEELEKGKVWSDIMHTDKMYYVGYCRAGELATIAVREAGRHFKLNVELSAGYMLGTNWASCH